MKKSLFVLITIFCSAIAVYAADLQILSVTPKGETDYLGRRAISVTFNQAVTALSENSAFSSADCPIQITPAVPGTCRFSGTQTLQFEPEQDWPLASRFNVKVPSGFTSRVTEQKLEKDYAWTFSTARPRVQRVLPSDNEQWIDVRPLIFVVLTQEVDLPSAQAATQLTYTVEHQPKPTQWWEIFKSYLPGFTLPQVGKRQTIPVEVRAITDEEYEANYSYLKRNRIFVARPTQDLPRNTQITLHIAPSLHGTEGPLGLEHEFTSVFYTYPPLQLVGGLTEGCLPFDAQIGFTSPVRLSELLQHITLSVPDALAEVSPEEAQTLGYQRYAPSSETERKHLPFPVTLPAGKGYFVMPLSFLRVQPKEPITVTVDKDLTDIYGQTLGMTQTFTLRNDGYCPAVIFKDGIGVLESYLPARHPIDVLNEKELQVSAGRFSGNDIVPFLQKDTNYCAEKEIDAKHRVYQGEYPFTITEDKTQKTYLDLSKFSPTARQSIIFSQVRVPSKYRQDGYCWERATDNITDLGLTMKTSPENILVWVTSLKDGQPRANATVQLRDDKNNLVWSGTTDKNGVAVAPGVEKLDFKSNNRWSNSQVYAIVTSEGGDALLVSSWNDGIEPWRFNLNYDYNPTTALVKTALFTDRGVYRPGETVYLKAITRVQDNSGWGVPTDKQVQVQIENSRGEEYLKKTLVYDEKSGAFDWSFELPADAPTGMWQIYVEGPQNSTENYSFRVEAVKQADFEIHLRADKEDFVSGENAKFMASADYLFGAPISGAKVNWTVRRSDDWFNPKGYEDYVFSPYFLTREVQEEEGLLTKSSGVLDAQGKINFEVALPQVMRRQKIYAELGVQAPSGQQLFARTSVTLNPADMYLGAYMERWNGEVGETIKTHLMAVDLQGKPTGPVKVRADIQKEEYFSIRKNGLAGRLEWVSERRIKKIGSQTFTISEKGYDFSFVPKEPGSYQITLSATDKQGRQVQGGFEVMVYGEGEAYWKANDDDILILQADKDTYQIGDTARVLVKSPYEQATALITVERGGVIDHWVKTISSGADYVDIPIKEAYVPNVFVSVMLVRGRAENALYDKEGLDLAKPQGKTGYVNLTVNQTNKEIQTRVTPQQSHYLPGEEVSVQIDTTLQGKAIPADVTFMVVDEGVLSLTGYKLPNLMSIFYAPQRLAVSTAANRLFLIGQRNFGEKGENRGGGGGLLSKLGGADLRSHFQFTPYFNAHVRTNEQGQATVTFTLPDNLTTFRLMAIANTVQEFGAGQASVKVSKPLMITPKMPRFARRGDKFSCGAVVFNYEDTKGDITVEAQAGGALRLNGGVQKIHVDKGAAKEVYWPCQTAGTGTAQLKLAAQGTQAKDGVEITLPVQEVEKQQTLALYAATDDSQTQVLDKPSSINEQVPSQVQMSLASTALLNLRGGMLYLLTYPYDCLEQKMSKILPIIEGAGLVEDFKLANIEEYKTTTQDILKLITQYQTSSGGFAYWPNSRLADAYVTAYTLETAYRAQQAGYAVPTEALVKAQQWLKDIFSGKQKQIYPYSALENKTMRAYAVYVLALYGDKLEAQFNALYEERNALTVPAQAYLLLAAQTLGKGQDIKQALAQGLLNQAQYGTQTLHFTADVPLPWLHMADVKVTSLVLEAFLRSGVELEQAHQVVRWLLEQLNAQGHWQNTVDNAAVFSALNTYYTVKENIIPDFSAGVAIGGREVFSRSFVGRSLQSQEMSLPFDKVYTAAPSVRVQIAKHGAGTLYYSLAQVYAPMSYDKSANAGFGVSRQITDMQGNAVSAFETGKRYKVTLTARTANNYSFVVLEDFIPAGFEIVNTQLATESQTDADSVENEPWNGFTRNEKYDDRIALFADYLPSGEHTYTYIVQATISGQFSYPSAWASQMYDPAVFGRTTTASVEIKPE